MKRTADISDYVQLMRDKPYQAYLSNALQVADVLTGHCSNSTSLRCGRFNYQSQKSSSAGWWLFFNGCSMPIEKKSLSLPSQLRNWQYILNILHYNTVHLNNWESSAKQTGKYRASRCIGVSYSCIVGLCPKAVKWRLFNSRLLSNFQKWLDKRIFLLKRP